MLVVFLCLLSVTLEATEGFKNLSGKVLQFKTATDNSYVKLYPEKPLSLSVFTLCMRVATELPLDREVILFAYYTPDVDELNVWRERDGRVSLYIQSSKDAAFFRLPPLSTLQTHLCVAWESATGLTAFWMDGRRSLHQVYRKGYSIRSGGTVVLGQDPDSYVGSFDVDQSFVGEIANLQMWDYVLSSAQIKAVYYNQDNRVKGNVFDWDTIEYDVTGNVLVATDN
ncbi:C-reactive protein [Danio rerio]|uniref:C-reactive protein n=1 Tax=Danio rerio TaxID=7955 RepID=A0AC58ISL6_DANRE